MPNNKKYYIVRGAQMVCDCGSHKRKINLPVSHGSYVSNNPMMNEDDYKPDVNIMYFGICKSGKNPNSETIYLITEKGKTISGKKCCPKFIKNWTKVKEDTKVDNKSALTTESQLICAYGGKITFISNGQENKK